MAPGSCDYTFVLETGRVGLFMQATTSTRSTLARQYKTNGIRLLTIFIAELRGTQDLYRIAMRDMTAQRAATARA